MKRPHRLAVAALALLCAATVPQGPGDTLTITRKETKLRAQKRVFAPAVADLREGDKLTCESKDGAWLRAKYKNVTGWLHATDASAKSGVRLSGEGVRESYSASEASAARKGFNPEVEREYKKGRPDLTAAFALVDQLGARRASDREVEQFLKDGGLWREVE